MKIFTKKKIDYYPLNSKLLDPANKKAIGKMKDGFKGKMISEFIGLKSEMYSLIDADNEEIKKAKGVNKNVVKRDKTYKKSIISITSIISLIFLKSL